jgi:hypothetical protein
MIRFEVRGPDISVLLKAAACRRTPNHLVAGAFVVRNDSRHGMWFL